MSQPKTGRIKWFAVAALAVAGAAFAFIALGGLGENLVYYWDPSELRQAGDKAIGATIRLGGQVAPGSIQFDPGTSKLAFEVTDGKQNIPVRSEGVPPQMFRENIGVIVEGTMTKEGHFTSSRLMVSHGNEYQAPHDGEKVDTHELMKTAEGVAE
ncbi:cytochrome c maturation protein CcmE [Vulgatibacter incomptus]|uniref:Cytochrome c-type biogenesis protein CcmE, heme chaperone n=1 Tax=Vulgatibacter incomptus TaxID=1391653 RepID=A0A0K1P8T4_9BACT|nr:cytochrome c maturation protein CcmE [Vulgatibacter incomptus]AKU89821.1 Cytochrome c-type biogenesis protein CcmE, heme chaperone [Vulgatibacter incomptus]